jgi:hypothetical protein
MAFLLYCPNYILSKLKVSLIPQKKMKVPLQLNYQNSFCNLLPSIKDSFYQNSLIWVELYSLCYLFFLGANILYDLFRTPLSGMREILSFHGELGAQEEVKPALASVYDINFP